MRKFLVIFIISMFIISLLPVGFARYGDYGGNRERNERDNDAREINRERLDDNSEKRVREKRDDIKDEVNEETSKMDRMMFKRVNLRSEEVSELRMKLRECKESNNENCREIKKDARDLAINILKGVTERTLIILNKLKAAVEESTTANKGSMLDDINSVIEAIEKAKTNILTLTKESSREEIKSAISQLKSALIEARSIIDRYYVKGRISKERVQNGINRYNNLADKIENRLIRFEERGFDFSDLGLKLDELRTKAISAQSNLDNGKLEAALTDLRDAHGITLSILKAFRANKAIDNPAIDVGDESEQ